MKHYRNVTEIFFLSLNVIFYMITNWAVKYILCCWTEAQSVFISFHYLRKLNSIALNKIVQGILCGVCVAVRHWFCLSFNRRYFFVCQGADALWLLTHIINSIFDLLYSICYSNCNIMQYLWWDNDRSGYLNICKYDWS